MTLSEQDHIDLDSSLVPLLDHLDHLWDIGILP